MGKTLLKIGEIASFFGISPKAMRIYEKKGLVIPRKKDPETGYRYYAPEQVITLYVLLALRSNGFSLGESRELLNGRISLTRFAELLQNKQKASEKSAAYAAGKISKIDRMVKKINESGLSCQLYALSDEQRAWLLSKMVMIGTNSAKEALSEALWV